VHAFLNTLDQRSYRAHGQHLEGGDRLDSYASLESWLIEHHLLDHPAPAGRARARHETLTLALEVRSNLRDAVRSSQDGPSPSELHGFTLVPCLGSDGVSLRVAPPPSPGLVAQGHAALGRLIVTCLELTITGRWKRLKMCPAPDCQWIFYDRSRPGTGRWCSPSLCGNRYKLRKGRATPAARVNPEGHPT
jgi:predicted RNA-binding Zn ribbon-like protein